VERSLPFGSAARSMRSRRDLPVTLMIVAPRC
jgi:hypothetical protein